MVVAIEIEIPSEVINFLDWILAGEEDIKGYCERAVISMFWGDIDCGKWGSEVILKKLEEFKVSLRDYGFDYLKEL